MVARGTMAQGAADLFAVTRLAKAFPADAGESMLAAGIRAASQDHVRDEAQLRQSFEAAGRATARSEAMPGMAIGVGGRPRRG